MTSYANAQSYRNISSISLPSFWFPEVFFFSQIVNQFAVDHRLVESIAGSCFHQTIILFLNYFVIQNLSFGESTEHFILLISIRYNNLRCFFLFRQFFRDGWFPADDCALRVDPGKCRGRTDDDCVENDSFSR